jgi:hypothetical protein
MPVVATWKLQSRSRRIGATQSHRAEARFGDTAGLEFIDENGGDPAYGFVGRQNIRQNKRGENWRRLRDVAMDAGHSWRRRPAAAPSRRPASSASTRTVAGQVCAFASRPSRGGENRQRGVVAKRTTIFSATIEAPLTASLEGEVLTS